MPNDQRNPNVQIPMTRANARTVHLGLVIGHWSLVIHCLLALGYWSLFPASAQPTPKLTSLSPEWIQRGTTLQIVFNGENLGNATGFIFNGDPGLAATNVPPPAPPKSAVTIESDLGGI